MRVLHSRSTAHPTWELGVGSSLLNSSILLLFRQPVTSSINVFTSSPTCLLVQTQLQSIQWPWKTIFSQHRPPKIRHFFPLGRCDCRWLRNDFSVSRAPEMSHRNIITIHFHIWTWYTPTIVIARACHGFSIKIYSNIVIYGRHRGHRHQQVAGTRQSFELVHFNEPVQNFGPPARNFGPPKTEFAWREWRKMLGRNVAQAPNRSANYTQLLATCSLMYIQLIFIACNIKKCFWLHFNRSKPCWSPGCVRNRQRSGTKYRLSRDVNTA